MSWRRSALLTLSLLAVACGKQPQDDGPGVFPGSPDAATPVPGTGGSPETGGSGPDAAPDTIPPKPVSGGLPCEVAQVLAAKCQTCHRKPPVFGAPMSLLNYADTQIPSPSEQGIVWESMKNKIAKGLMPPPTTPSGPLTATEKATLTAWLEAGAPAGADACTPPPDAGAPTNGP